MSEEEVLPGEDSHEVVKMGDTVQSRFDLLRDRRARRSLDQSEYQVQR